MSEDYCKEQDTVTYIYSIERDFCMKKIVVLLCVFSSCFFGCSDLVNPAGGKISPPSITTGPSNQSVTAGQTATFSVVASGTNLQYQWQKGITDIPGADTVIYTTPATMLSDSGATFRCIVSNSAGKDTTASVLLIVTTKIVAPSITVGPATPSVTSGQTATFSVVASGANLHYQWQKGTTNISGANAAIYTTPVTTMADSGSTYRCIISNSAGNDTTAAVPLAVAPVLSIAAVTISFDFTSGNIGLYRIFDSTAFKDQLPNWTDNDVRTFGGAIYVLERYGKDNIMKINGPTIAESSVAYEKNIGAAVNIQDIAFVNATKAYVTQLGSSKLVIIDPSTGLKTGKTIDLSAFNSYAGTKDSDVVPYMSRELFYNGKVYVACQRLKAPPGGYIQAADTSKIVVIDAAADSVEKAINLVYKNPQELSICNGKLYVGSVGIWGANDAGIEAIDLSTDANIGSVVTEGSFSGDIASIIVISDTKGYAVISTPSYTTEVHPFNPQTKNIGPKIAGIDAPCSNHMAFDGKYVYVGDRSTTTPGIAVIDPATDLKVGTTKNIGLPPNSLAILESN
jgi:hypothetical protein